MNTNIEVLRELDELVEAARLLGVTQAKKGFGCHTDEDRRFERAMYESIDKHRAALLDWEAKQPAPQQPAAAQQQGRAVAFEGTDREVLREFIRMCREDKPVGQWPGERVCAAIERSMANERPFRFIAEADMAPEREPSMKDADRALSGPRRNTAPPPSVPEAVRLLREYRKAPKFSNDHDAIKRTVALEDEIDAFLAAAPALAQQPAAADFCDGHCTWRDHAPGCPRHEGQQPAASAPVEVRNAILEALNLVHAEGRARVESATAEMADRLAALAQQPAAVGEEIMVNAAHDVYTLPLQPSGLSSGPRFVVHVPGPEQPAGDAEAEVLAKYQPCGCVICTCEDEKQCQGCGAKHCGNRTDHPAYVKRQPEAWITPGGDVSRSFHWCLERCLPGQQPRPLYAAPQQPAAADEVKCPWDGGSPGVEPMPAGMVYPKKPEPRASGYLDSSGVEWNAWDAGQMEAYARAAYSDGWEAGYRAALAAQHQEPKS